MKAVVTGGAGFIGSNLVLRLLQDENEVVVIDSLAAGHERVAAIEDAGASLHRADIRSPEAADVIRSFKPDIIFHLAAQLDVRVSVRRPAFDADVNVVGTLNMLEAARDVSARFVFASSGGCIYGEVPAGRIPVSEEYAGVPDSPYGISKKSAGEYVRFFSEMGLGAVSLALGNVYGPGQDPLGEAGVVAIFGLRMLSAQECIIYGDGKQTRDFVFISDVVDAFLAASTAGEGELINIGTSIETSVEELHQLLGELIGDIGDPQYHEARPGELQRSCLDISKANDLLQWEPKVGLREGLAATVEYLRGKS